MDSQRVHYVDASVLVKLAIKETGSETIETYMAAEPTSKFYATSFSFAETLGGLKSKYSYKEIDQETYAKAGDLLKGTIGDRIELVDVDISESEIFWEVEKTTKLYALDIVDAYQIVTIKKDLFSRVSESEPILMTADSELAEVGRKEGLKVWDCLQERAP
jgi:predicted nucleic acid-binding protein